MGDRRLEGRKALVTGSTRGIGRAVAELFARHGASVVVTGLERGRGEDVARSIVAAGGTAVFLPADLTVEEQVRDLVDGSVEALGGLTTLVNSAAPTEVIRRSDAAVSALSTDDWERLVRGTLTSAFWLSRFALGPLAASGPGSAIVHMSSESAHHAMPGLTAYSAAKAGVEALTRSLALEGAAAGVRSNAIQIGLVLSEESRALLPANPAMEAGLRALHLTRPGLPEDVAYAALFLASSESEFVTGVTLPVDGGLNARGRLADMSSWREVPPPAEPEG